ncbi:unnamed protein product [Phytophthora lilii]|uniref:Unnamed protein product n=1 Tax=Phytophthora lilii TaxID=2077276 RepID=A0A9W6TJ58_9STRA|nr:unnamed protein product [Phytophthora lilii]
MLAALSAFDASTSPTHSSATASTSQSEDDKNDAIATKLREKAVTVQQPRDALFVAVHALLLEAGTREFSTEAFAGDLISMQMLMFRLQGVGCCELGVFAA